MSPPLEFRTYSDYRIPPLQFEQERNAHSRSPGDRSLLQKWSIEDILNRFSQRPQAETKGSGDSEEALKESDLEDLEKKGDEGTLVTWDGDNDPQNPLNWSYSRKWIGTWLVSCFTFISPLASTMVAPALDTIADDFDIESDFMRMFVMAIFLLGFAVGPFVIGPLSEVFGRVKVLQLCNLWFLVFNGLCGFARNKDEMLAFRFLSGMGGSAPQAIGQGILADIWTKEERGLGSAIYGLMTWLGPAIGPIAGAFCTHFTTWRWVFWATSLFSIAIQALAIFFLSESYGPYLLRQKAKKLRNKTGDMSLKTEHDQKSVGQMLSKALVRPFVMLFTQPAIISISVYRAFFYGVMYLVLSTFPEVWEDEYDMEVHIASLNYLSLGIGFFIGLFLTGHLQDWLYARLKTLYNTAEGKPEYRIPPMLLGGVLSPAGLLTYGWAVQAHTHWIVPDVGAAIFACGLIVIFQCAQNYLIDAYTTHAASAAGAAAFLRTMAGFSFPLFADRMYDALEWGWGNTLLAGVSFVLGLPAAWALWVFGERIRARSKYCSG